MTYICRCETCGAEFVPRKRGKGRPQMFCSPKCAVRHHQAIAKAQRPTFVKKCVICGAEFETRRDTVCCCSPKCSRAYKAEWKRRRREKGWAPKSPQSDAVKDHAHFYERTYAAIKRKRHARPAVVGGRRGQPVMGGGSAARSNWAAAQ